MIACLYVCMYVVCQCVVLGTELITGARERQLQREGTACREVMIARQMEATEWHRVFAARQLAAVSL
jgi:hypothetical protein